MRKHLVFVLALVIAILPVASAQAAEKNSAGNSCSSDSNSFDWDTGWQCQSGSLARAPLFVGSASAYTCNSTNYGLIQWTGSAFQGCTSSGWGTFSQWTTSGSNIYYSIGSVGIGTTAAATALTVAGPISLQEPAAAITATTYTVATTDSSLIFAPTGTTTVTLPTASSYPGRILHLSNTAAYAVISASSNVVPQAGGSAGTAILPATAGAYAELQSNGTNWITMMSGGSGGSSQWTTSGANVYYNIGSVGVGTATPQSALHAYNGEVQIGSSGTSCATANNGALRYSGGFIYYCTGTTWTLLQSSISSSLSQTNPFSDGGETDLYQFQGNANDSVGSNNGTVTGSLAYTSGYAGQAAYFGTSNYVTLPFALSNSPTSVFVRVNMAASSGGGVVAAQQAWDGTSGRWDFTVSSTTLNLDISCAGVNNNNDNPYQYTGTIPTGVWIEIGFVYTSAASQTLYLNGIPVLNSGGSGCAMSNYYPLHIGAIPNAPWYFNGSMENLRIFNEALTPAQVYSLYQNGL